MYSKSQFLDQSWVYDVKKTNPRFKKAIVSFYHHFHFKIWLVAFLVYISLVYIRLVWFVALFYNSVYFIKFCFFESRSKERIVDYFILFEKLGFNVTSFKFVSQPEKIFLYQIVQCSTN